jgi:hypothetical protein
MNIKGRRGEEKFFKDTKLEFNILTLWEMQQGKFQYETLETSRYELLVDGSKAALLL